MRVFLLSHRLSACERLVRRGSRVADVGTDHAQIPVRLVMDGISPRVIATDIAEGPCETAKGFVKRYGLSDKIDVRNCDGLSGVSANEVDDIIIAGMGGDVMISILSAAVWLKSSSYRLILQPMTKAEKLRAWLLENGFDIISETAVTDAGRSYTIMLCGYDGVKRHPSDIAIYGGRLLYDDSPAAKDILERQAKLLYAQAGGLEAMGEEDKAQRLTDIADALVRGR